MRYGAPSRDAQAYREEERLRGRLGEVLLDARLVKAHLRVGGGEGAATARSQSGSCLMP